MSLTDRTVEPLNPIIDLAALVVAVPGPPAEPVFPDSYPFTYTYDVVRENRDHFEGLFPAVGPVCASGRVPSRTDAAAWLRRACGGSGVLGVDNVDSTHPEYVGLCCELADAYIRSKGLVWPPGGRAQVAARFRVVSATGRIFWKD